ncbi:MAG: hypothetical protein GTO63_28025 [Anaerolineae bacterium]|nr:hypothetical protein [Anaerolineae bacterium]NIN98592.1 hypothetical protein [Anaerolineae bacterium]NIQ81476.1 hypothetical protein [Anaerolineae bacterium]
MDTREATDLRNWLEEERRRDKALLDELQKRVDEHEDQFSASADKMDRLEEGLAQTRAEGAGVSRFDQALQQYKKDLLLEMQRWQERLRKETDRQDEVLRRERQDRVTALAKLEERVEETLRLQQLLEIEKAEMQRLNKVASELRLQLEDTSKTVKGQQETLVAVGEQISRNDQRLAQLLQGQEDAKASSERIAERLKYLEGWAERGAQQMADLQAFGEQLREEQAQFLGELRTVDDRRKKQIAQWAKELRTWRDEAKSTREQLALSEKQYRSAEKMLGSLEEMKIQLEKDREAVEHSERTAEERQRQQLEDWRKENELLWLRNEERWQQLGEENAKRDAHVALLWESHAAHLRRQIGEFDKLIKELEKRLLRAGK